MDVSVIIVNYNTRDMLRDCLSSLAEKTSGLSFETIVLDNDSSDGSAEMVGKMFPETMLVCAGENLGFGKANNLGATRARGKYLFFLNSDTVLINNALYELFSFMERTPACAIAGGNLFDIRGRPIHGHSLALPSPATDLVRLLPGSFRLLYGKNWTHNFTGKPLRVAYVTGADLMMPKCVFDQVGGFDPSFFMYYEETELASRVRALGLYAYSVPTAKITHIKGGSLENLDSVKSIVYQSKYRYMAKVHGKYGAIRSYLAFSFFCLVKITMNALRFKNKSVKRYTELLLLNRQIFRSESR